MALLETIQSPCGLNLSSCDPSEFSTWAKGITSFDRPKSDAVREARSSQDLSIGTKGCTGN